jgi:hypothetical protein
VNHRRRVVKPGGIKTGALMLSWDESEGNLFTALAVPGMKRSSPECHVNRWPGDHAAILLVGLVLWSSVLAGGGSIPSSARSSLSW